jgi:HEAT repeat protein
LIEALQHDQHRGMAAKFLADHGAKDAIPALERMLGARNADARRSGAIALGRLGA